MKTKIINLLIKFILPHTDYDKLKEENEALKEKINILIEEPYSSNACIIIAKHNLRKQISSLVWFADMDLNPDSFEGIIKHATI